MIDEYGREVETVREHYAATRKHRALPQMRNIVLDANEHGKLWELRFPISKRYAESWTWQPAWALRAGECKVTNVSKKIAMALTEYALANECEGDIDAFPRDLMCALRLRKSVPGNH